MTKPTLEQVFEVCRRYLLAIAIDEIPKELRAKGGASDLVQQTLVTAIRCENQFRGTTFEEFRGWLKAILRSEAAAFRRKYASTACRSVHHERSLEDEFDQLVDLSTPNEKAHDDEWQSRLAEELSDLNEVVQRVIEMRLEHKLSFVAIGNILGRSEEATRKLFVRGLGELRRRMSSVPSE